MFGYCCGRDNGHILPFLGHGYQVVLICLEPSRTQSGLVGCRCSVNLIMFSRTPKPSCEGHLPSGFTLVSLFSGSSSGPDSDCGEGVRSKMLWISFEKKGL